MPAEGTPELTQEAESCPLAAWRKAKTALDENLSWKTGAMPSNPMAAVFKGAQDRAMQIAMENAALEEPLLEL